MLKIGKLIAKLVELYRMVVYSTIFFLRKYPYFTIPWRVSGFGCLGTLATVLNPGSILGKRSDNV